MKLVIFDLDGTLIDSAKDIAHSVNEVREHLALTPLPLDEVESYIGNGVGKLLELALPGCAGDVQQRAYEIYLPIYRRRLLDTTRPYPGVLAALEQLAASGYAQAVLTNKPVRESLLILEGLGMDRYFTPIYGGDSFPRKKPDPTGIHRIVTEIGVTLDDALFVGDSSVDFETAQNAGVRCCLVTYGIRPAHIAALDPDYRIDDLQDLTEILNAL